MMVFQNRLFSGYVYDFCLFDFQVTIANGSLEFSAGSIRYLRARVRGETTLTPSSSSEDISKWLPIILGGVLLLAVVIMLVGVVAMARLVCIKRRSR